jgi:hypothetical protein
MMGIILFIVFTGIIIGLLYMFVCIDPTTRKEDLEAIDCAPEVKKEEPSPAVKAFKTFMTSKYHRERKNKEASA